MHSLQSLLEWGRLQDGSVLSAEDNPRNLLEALHKLWLPSLTLLQRLWCPQLPQDSEANPHSPSSEDPELLTSCAPQEPGTQTALRPRVSP